MTNEHVAAVLTEIGTLLELQGESTFRSNAYHNGARAIEQLDVNVAELIRDGKLDEVRGIGEALREKITTLVTTGSLPYHDDLRSKTPAGLFDLLRIPGLGPKKVKSLFDLLKIDDLAKLKAACEAGTVASLKGFGAKTQQKILEGIAFLDQVGDRVRIDRAEALAQALMDGLKAAPGIIRMELCGSLRRRRETIKDIDLLVELRRRRADHATFRHSTPGRSGRRSWADQVERHGQQWRGGRTPRRHERRPPRRHRQGISFRLDVFHG